MDFWRKKNLHKKKKKTKYFCNICYGPSYVKKGFLFIHLKLIVARTDLIWRQLYLWIWVYVNKINYICFITYFLLLLDYLLSELIIDKVFKNSSGVTPYFIIIFFFNSWFLIIANDIAELLCLCLNKTWFVIVK